MDTKSPNNINDRHSFTGLLSKAFLLFLSVLLISCAAIVAPEKSVVFNSYFYDNANIRDEAVRYAKNLQRYYIYFKNFDPTAAERKISEIDRFLQNEKGVVSDSTIDSAQSDSHITDNSSGDGSNEASIDLFSTAKPEELYNFEIEKLRTMTVIEVTEKEQKLSEALQNYYSVRNYIDTNSSFHYYIYNTNYGRLIATNADNFDKETVYDSISITDPLFESVEFNNCSLAESFINNAMSCTISIPTDSNSYFIENEVKLQKRLTEVNKVLASPITSLLLIVFGMLIFGYVMYCHRAMAKGVNAALYGKFRRIPLVLKLIMLLCIVFLYVHHYKANYVISSLIAQADWDSVFLALLSAFTGTVLVILTLENILSIIKNPKLITEETDVNFVMVSARNFRFALRTQSYLLIFIYISVTLLFIASFVFMLLALPMAFKSLHNMIIYLLLCFPLFITAMVIKLINAHIKLCWYIKEMSLGNIEIIPQQKGLFTAPLNNLNNINDGVKRTMDEAIRNERLKSELITNVSHDLKTPLTSIISYVNLLKELKIKNSSADEYIDVIEHKATRLKILIDDLFEASKLSSGQMKLEKHRSDVVSLLKQTMGELSYKMDESGISFITSLPSTPVMLDMDGQKMWRVFDNMLNNILKYSPKQSRAYIDMKDESERITITFKNVSSYPLNFDTGELFERFKRGDAARATEGSGLGLSIAKSIVELHGGDMSIVTDGDLFKVIIVLYKNNTD